MPSKKRPKSDKFETEECGCFLFCLFLSSELFVDISCVVGELIKFLLSRPDVEAFAEPVDWEYFGQY